MLMPFIDCNLPVHNIKPRIKCSYNLCVILHPRKLEGVRHRSRQQLAGKTNTLLLGTFCIEMLTETNND